jgi:transketolase N-terminal domain/subunit
MLENISIKPIIEFIVYLVMVSFLYSLSLSNKEVYFCTGECSEGSVWESFAFGSFYKLDNLCAVIDVNRLGQSDPAPLQHDMETYRKRVDAFG